MIGVLHLRELRSSPSRPKLCTSAIAAPQPRGRSTAPPRSELFTQLIGALPLRGPSLCRAGFNPPSATLPKNRHLPMGSRIPRPFALALAPDRESSALLKPASSPLAKPLLTPALACCAWHVERAYLILYLLISVSHHTNWKGDQRNGSDTSVLGITWIDQDGP